MRVPKLVVEERMEHFVASCRERDVKITHQRLEIYREVASTTEHPDAVTVHNRVRKRIPTISLDTVYRNLRVLEKYGLIRIVGMSNERLRFDANIEPHHHFTCVKCWRICDFQSERLNGLRWPDEARIHGDPISLHIEVRGLCKHCQKS